MPRKRHSERNLSNSKHRKALLDDAKAIMADAEARGRRGGSAGAALSSPGRPGERKAAPAEEMSVEEMGVEELRQLTDDEVDMILDRISDLLEKLDEAFPGELEQFVEELQSVP